MPDRPNEPPFAPRHDPRYDPRVERHGSDRDSNSDPRFDPRDTRRDDPRFNPRDGGDDPRLGRTRPPEPPLPPRRNNRLVWLVGALALLLLLTRTRVGLIIRAALSHPNMVGTLGHNVPMVFMLVFGVGCGLAALAGVIAGPALVTYPAMAAALGPILFVVVVLGSIARANGFRIFKFVNYIKEELLIVLGTSSSESALPRMLDKMEKLGCKKSVVGLVIPTGYSFNLDGTNIYMTLAALFIAQATGIELSWGDQIALLLVAMISSKGAAGVSGAGFITLAATLAIVPSVPVAGLALILGIDRFMSECRALTNFMGNAVATIVVARWENALDRDQLSAALAKGGGAGPAIAGLEADTD